MTECIHRWRIALPEGETSEGRCVKCGAVKLFRNSNPELHDFHTEKTRDTWAILERLGLR